MRVAFNCVFCLTIFLQLQAQEIRIWSGFMEERTKIAEPVHYYISVHYPKDQKILLADSLYNYAPFEWEGKTYFESTVRGDTIIDSAIYELTTFELDSQQYLQLPVFLIEDGDSTVLTTKSDFITLEYEVKEPPQEIELKEKTGYVDPRYPIDYPLILSIAGAILAILLILFGIFFKRISRWWKVRRLKQKHSRFQLEFSQMINHLTEIRSVETLEDYLSAWKEHAEYLTGAPFTKYTSREMVKKMGLDSLKEEFDQIDGAIYGGRNDRPLYPAFEQLKEQNRRYYEKRLKEVKNA